MPSPFPPLLSPPLPANTAETTKAGVGDNPGRVEDAARQFESLLTAQMLRSAREASDGSMGDEEQESEKDTMMGIAEQEFAQMLSRQGGLGLTRLILDGLRATPAIRQVEH